MADKKKIFDTVPVESVAVPVEIKKPLDNFLTLPANASTALAMGILGASTYEALSQYIDRSEIINNKAKFSIETQEYTKYKIKKYEEDKEDKEKPKEEEKVKRAVISYESDNNTIELVHPDISSLDTATEKLFTFLLIEACKNCVSEGELYKDSFTFKTSDLVEAGVYKDIRSAKRALVEAKYNLLFLAIGQTDRTLKEKKKGKDQTTEQSFDVGVIFTRIKLNRKGECFIRINKDINWEMITEYWTILPIYYHLLSKRGRALLRYIFLTARLHAKEKKFFSQNSRGEDIFNFSIPFRTLQTKLYLPSENTVDKEGKPCFIKRATEYIRQPLINAVDEIMRYHNLYYENEEFRLFPIVNNSLDIKRWLDKGKLGVTLSGNFLKTFLDIALSRERIIEKQAARKAQIEDEAKTRALAKTIEEAAKASES